MTWLSSSDTHGRPSSEPVYIEEPAFSKWLVESSRAAWIWLVARPWLGWEWLQAGWSKVFAGTAGVNPAMIVVSLFLILACATPAGTAWTGSCSPAWGPPGTRGEAGTRTPG
jgi:hypothetical protein